MHIIFILTAFVACVMGTICGMGGGVIIKPVLDASHSMSTVSVNLISGIVVVGMTVWSVGKSIIKRESEVRFSVTGYLAVSSAVGGILGKQLFEFAASCFENPDMAAGVQGICLFLATFATLIYTLRKDKLHKRDIQSKTACLCIGTGLGMLGSFLGIGGGPFNVAVLCYFFSMPTKTAAQNSLFIVLFGQLAGTMKALYTDGMQDVSIPLLAAMVLAGIVGSEVGRRLNKHLDNKKATVCLEGAMIVIMVICFWNILNYL